MTSIWLPAIFLFCVAMQRDGWVGAQYYARPTMELIERYGYDTIHIFILNFGIFFGQPVALQQQLERMTADGSLSKREYFYM